MKRYSSGLVALIAMLVLAACGGPAPTPQAGSVSIKPGSLLLENIGTSETLKATVLDSSGKELSQNVSWESSKPDVASVDANGVVKGLKVGSSLITAKVGTVSSTPIIASVGTLSSAVVRIPNERVVSGPVFAEGVTPFTLDSEYTVVLKDVSPTAGRLWFSKSPEGVPVMGQVVSSKPVATGIEVVLKVVPLSTIFSSLNVEEAIEVKSPEISEVEAQNAGFHVKKLPSGAYEFTPKEGTELGVQPAFAVGDYDCDGDLTPQNILTLRRPTFILNPGNPRLEVLLDLSRFRVLFSASPSLLVSSGIQTINGNFSANLSCKLRGAVDGKFLELFGFTFYLRMAPALKIDGNYTAGSRNFSALISSAGTIRLGFDCRSNPFGCSNLSQSTMQNRGNVNLAALQSLGASIRNLKPEVSFDSLISVQTPVSPLRFALLEARPGFSVTFDLAPLQTQIDEKNPADYSVASFAVLRPGSAVRDLLGFFLGVNQNAFSATTVNGSSILSPLISSAKISDNNVSVSLDPSRINFYSTVGSFGLGYNIQAIRLIEVNANNQISRTVTQFIASDGQTNFTIPIPVLNPAVDTNRLYAAVVPKVMPELPVGVIAVSP